MFAELCNGFDYEKGRIMKKIEAVIQPFKLDDVRESLQQSGVEGMTVSDVRGHGHQKGHKEVYRGQEYEVNLLPKVKVEVVVSDNRVRDTVEAIIEAARTGKIGDGKVFVYPVEEVVRIRNNDTGDAAL